MHRPGPPVAIGERVTGAYLGLPFAGKVTGVSTLSQPDRFRVSLDFDEAVDVVRFEGLSNFRKRVSAVIGLDGRSPEKTSNGRPQLELAI